MSTHHEYCGNNIHTAELILSHSIRLSSHIMTPINSGIDSSDISFSGRMDEWISRQHMILVAAQEHQLQSDQHKRITMSTRMFCIHLQWVEVTNYFPSIKDHIRLLEDLVRGKQIETHVHNLRAFILNPTQVNPLDIAQRNEQEFRVEEVIAHRSDHRRRSTMEILRL